MPKCFYFICPTECLEHTINTKFKYENYFYTSLGNSFVFDNQTLMEIKQIIQKNEIGELCFVLSMDNRIILDAIGKQEYSNIRGLHNSYNEIIKQKKCAQVFSLSSNPLFLMISHYLNKKIKELQLQLSNLLDVPIKIGGKIYNKDQDIFKNIYSDLVFLEKHNLN